MRHEVVLQLDRGDPLAAGLDDVLGPVGEGDEAVGRQGADVAGTQPAVAELARVGLLVAEVGGGHPGAAHLQLADRLAVRGQHLLGRPDDPCGHTGRHPALGVPVPPGLLALGAGRRAGHRAQRRRLGHPPGVDDVDVVAVLERPHQRRRARRTAHHDLAQRRHVGRVVVQVGEQIGPDRRHRGTPRRLLRLDHRGQRSGLQEPVGHQHRAAGHQRRVRQSQAIAWNIGTMPSTISRLVNPNASGMQTSMECSQIERCEYATPFGFPVVPDV